MKQTSSPSPILDAPRRAYRSSDDRWLGGVASGLAHHLGLPVLWVRMGLLVLVAFGGFGAVLYAGLWLFLPARRHTDPLSPGLDAATRQGKRGGRRERRFADYGGDLHTAGYTGARDSKRPFGGQVPTTPGWGSR